jgi:hypothetical protein
MQQTETLIQAVVEVAVETAEILLAAAALVLLFFRYQQLNTLEQPQEAQQSQQAVQTQF